MKTILISTLVLITYCAQSQDREQAMNPKLILDLPLVDVSYLKHSTQSRANYRAGVSNLESVNVGVNDYIGLLESPSMFQVMGYTSSFYNAMNFGIAKAWNKWKDPNKSKSNLIWNGVLKELSAAVAFAATTKVPFAGGWAHEEFHRNTWAQHGIGSYNEIWEWNLSPDALSYVSHLQDDDLSWFKANDPAGFVRMGSAGIEAHFLTNEILQTQDFLYDTHLPNLALYWADVLAPLDYVNRASTTKTIAEHSELYYDEREILKRDFTGNDFTGWVYDLFLPNESYDERGVHPTGIGIDRYRTYDDLSADMLSYIEKMGNRQYLNFISPFMIGIRTIKINEKISANFAMRHYLTSFGDDVQLELYGKINKINAQLVVHNYSNHAAQFRGLEARIFAVPVELGRSKKIIVDSRLMAWNQPANQEFKTSSSELGGLASMELSYGSKSKWKPYLNLETKSAGWVAGNPFLGDQFSFRVGCQGLF